MKNKIKLVVLMSVLSVGSAFAATPHGVYLNTLGGYEYLADSEIGSLQTQGSFPNSTVSPNLTENSSGFSGRAALGYYFYSNPVTSWAYGLELGYNYLSPANSSANTVVNPGENYYINANEKTNAWAGDLDFIISKSISKNVSLFSKIGLGYEEKTERFNASATGEGGSPTPVYGTNTVNNSSSIGAVGGLGLQYALTQNVAFQTEIDAMKGGTGFGYAQILAGLSFTF